VELKLTSSQRSAMQLISEVVYCYGNSDPNGQQLHFSNGDGQKWRWSCGLL